MKETPELPAASDPLGETLHLLRLEGTLYCQSSLTAPWGIDIPALAPQMSFIVVTQGKGWILLDDHPPHLLEPGRLTLVPHGVRHRVVSAPSVCAEPLFELPIQKISERYERLCIGGGGELSQFTYGVVRFEHAAASRLLSALPPLLCVQPWADGSGWMQSTLHLIEREARALRPGGETVITRLADILVIQAIRAWLASAPEAHQGWFAAVRDPQIGQALSLMHRQPERDLGVVSLAKSTGMSRSAFSARFTELVGESPMRYLTRWRLELAHFSLRHDKIALADLAVKSGYQSDEAFCRAFKREFGVTAASVRRGNDKGPE